MSAVGYMIKHRSVIRLIQQCACRIVGQPLRLPNGRRAYPTIYQLSPPMRSRGCFSPAQFVSRTEPNPGRASDGRGKTWRARRTEFAAAGYQTRRSAEQGMVALECPWSRVAPAAERRGPRKG